MDQIYEKDEFDFYDNCGDCRDLLECYKLIDSLVSEIGDLEAEIVRWRVILTKYLPKDAAERLFSDLFSNLAMRREGDYAYDAYLREFGYKEDPLESKEHLKLMKLITTEKEGPLRDIMAALAMV